MLSLIVWTTARRTYPVYDTHCSWNDQGGGVVAEPGEVHGDFHPEVFTNIVQRLGTEECADPAPLQFL